MNKKRKKGRHGGIRPVYPYTPVSEALIPSFSHSEMGFRRKSRDDSDQEKRYMVDLSTVETTFQPEDLNIPLCNILQCYHYMYHKSYFKANTRACLSVFSADNHLLDRLKDFYEKK